MSGRRIFSGIRKWLQWRRRLNGCSNPRQKSGCLRSDDKVQLFYEFYAQTLVGGKWLCVVVSYPPDDGFVVTAYLTDQLKAGETIWPTK